MHHILGHSWRNFFARLPLPMLALAASYGVYRFSALFVPQWVAIVQAAAFECTYVGLALVDNLEEEQRVRSRWIGIGAVIVSILYNSLDGLFHRQPVLLSTMPLWGDIVLAILHGAPMAWLAYLVANLLLHQSLHLPSNNGLQSPETPLVGGRTQEYTVTSMIEQCTDLEHLKRQDIVDRLGCSPATASKLISEALSTGLVKKNGAGYIIQK